MLRNQLLTRYRQCFMPLALLFLLPGCADLQAVRDFAATSAATADYRQIVSDYAESPLRQQRYSPARRAPSLQAEAELRRQQQQRLEAAQTVLVEYMSALGALAAGELISVDAEIDKLAKASGQNNASGSTDATGTAAANIAKIVSRAALGHWQQAQLRRLIRDADSSVQRLTRGLQEIVLTDFPLSFDQEAEAVYKYFQSSIASAASRGDAEAVEPLAKILWFDHVDRITERRARLQKYAAVLEKIGAGHADLAANVGNLDGDALKQRLRQNSRDLRQLYRAIAVLRQ